MKLWRLAGCVLLALAPAAGCKQPSEKQGLIESAEFGVVYGGQIQQREEIPFELDRTRQKQGFRIEFARPLPRPVTVEWEIDMPGSSKRVRDHRGRVGRGRLVRIQQAQVPAGRERFDQLLPFEPGDPLGTWNLRVTVDERIVIDRPFLVYDAAARRRARERDAAP